MGCHNVSSLAGYEVWSQITVQWTEDNFVQLCGLQALLNQIAVDNSRWCYWHVG